MNPRRHTLDTRMQKGGFIANQMRLRKKKTKKTTAFKQYLFEMETIPGEFVEREKPMRMRNTGKSATDRKFHKKKTNKNKTQRHNNRSIFNCLKL